MNLITMILKNSDFRITSEQSTVIQGFRAPTATWLIDG